MKLPTATEAFRDCRTRCRVHCFGADYAGGVKKQRRGLSRPRPLSFAPLPCVSQSYGPLSLLQLDTVYRDREVERAADARVGHGHLWGREVELEAGSRVHVRGSEVIKACCSVLGLGSSTAVSDRRSPDGAVPAGQGVGQTDNYLAAAVRIRDVVLPSLPPISEDARSFSCLYDSV